MITFDNQLNDDHFEPWQIGNFLNINLFNEAIYLLEFQINFKYRGFNTLNFHWIRKTDSARYPFSCNVIPNF